MKKITRGISYVLSLAVLFGAVFGSGYYTCKRHYEKEAVAEVVEQTDSDDFDLKLPGETERRIVTKNEVESRIFEIGELSTYCEEYTVAKTTEETRNLLDKIKVFGTTNKIALECSGVIKVGYNMLDIIVKVGSDTIYVSIPEADVNDNYVVWDSLKCEEKNNILNPIEFSQYEQLVKEIEEEGLSEAEAKGIYEKADTNFQNIIRAFLSEFEGYAVEFL